MNYHSNTISPKDAALNKKMGSSFEFQPFNFIPFKIKLGGNKSAAGGGGGGGSFGETPKTTTSVNTTTAPTTQPSNQPKITSSSNNQPLMQSSQNTPTQPKMGTPLYYAGQVEKAGQQTPWEQAAAENLANAKGMQNFGQFAPNAEAPFYAGAGRPQMETLITRPDLVGRDQQGLYNKFANLYGTQANVGLQAAQTAAARGLEAAQSGLTASLPQQIGLQSTLYNPLEGAGAAQGLGTRSLIAGDVASAQDLREKRNAAAANLSSIGNIENLMKQVLGGNVNPSDINAINSFVNTISSNVSSPQYQAFNQYLSSLKSLYADYLSRGGTLTNMSREEANSLLNGTASAQTLLKGLENLRNEAGAYLSGYDTQINQIVGGLNTGTPYTPTSTNTSGSTGGGLSGYANGGAF